MEMVVERVEATANDNGDYVCVRIMIRDADDIVSEDAQEYSCVQLLVLPGNNLDLSASLTLRFFVS
jgi:hypothetical protein